MDDDVANAMSDNNQQISFCFTKNAEDSFNRKMSDVCMAAYWNSKMQEALMQVERNEFLLRTKTVCLLKEPFHNRIMKQLEPGI